jgi:hypothetical protein
MPIVSLDVGCGSCRLMDYLQKEHSKYNFTILGHHVDGSTTCSQITAYQEFQLTFAS